MIGLVCAMISRVFLFIAALDISAGWAVGVLLPFGPLVFRLSYPESAERSKIFRFATLPCFLLYLIIDAGPLYHGHLTEIARSTDTVAVPVHYSLEKPAAPQQKTASPTPKPALLPSADERRAANTREFDRLRLWNEALTLKKRDLLHSDAEGNLNYNVELAQYKVALEKANAERNALWPSAK